MSLSLDISRVKSFISDSELLHIEDQVKSAHTALHNKTGAGSDFLGWINLPSNINQQELHQIKAAAKKIRSSCDVFVVIGIGGSYLGARAAIEFVKSGEYNQIREEGTPEIYFVGNSLSPDYLNNILKMCQGKDICINVISKSGTTTEPALAFRIFRDLLIKKYGEEESARRIFCTTDKNKGTLKALADKSGYETFVVPDDIGGRYSVLTAVGLLPIAVAGCDVDAMLAGAVKAEKEYSNPNLLENDCYKYAALRNILYRRGKAIEVLVSYEPAFTMMGEWYKQLFGESEGKDGKGIFPASMIFSTDLHSLGQFVQDGSRNLFETVVNIQSPSKDIVVEADPQDFDGLNFLASMTMSEINHKAMQGTMLAHLDGGVPNIVINIPNRSEDSLGQLFYFFEKACAISGYILGVNPFDQPGVEDYKINMFALLGKSGFEDRRKELEKLL